MLGIGAVVGVAIAVSGIIFGTKAIDAGLALVALATCGRLGLAIRYRRRPTGVGATDAVLVLGIALALGVLIAALIGLASPSCSGCVAPR